MPNDNNRNKYRGIAMRRYHIEVIGNEVVYGYLKDQDGNYYHNYKEDSYVCDGGGCHLPSKQRKATHFG